MIDGGAISIRGGGGGSQFVKHGHEASRVTCLARDIREVNGQKVTGQKVTICIFTLADEKSQYVYT